MFQSRIRQMLPRRGSHLSPVPAIVKRDIMKIAAAYVPTNVIGDGIHLMSSSRKFGSKAYGPLTETIPDHVECARFHRFLTDRHVEFFTGVPDSLLKDYCAYVEDHVPPDKHVITPNEGSAVALAAGYHLATGSIPLVYLQNSGLGNTINPLLSLVHPRVYSIPMILLIGWRGEPGHKDEPQHVLQGKVTPALLSDMGINYEVLPDYDEGAEQAVEQAIASASMRQAPYALVVRKATFSKYKLKSTVNNQYSVSREQAISTVIKGSKKTDAIISTTGFTSRELFEIRRKKGHSHSHDFLTVGSMGHCSSIALGTALGQPQRQVYVLDGDGGLLMHLGSLTSPGSMNVPNFKHIVFNNGVHDSVGGQRTVGFNVDFPAMALAAGYKHAARVDTMKDFKRALETLRNQEGPAFLEVRVKSGARGDLGRPDTGPIDNKLAFMAFLRD